MDDAGGTVAAALIPCRVVPGWPEVERAQVLDHRYEECVAAPKCTVNMGASGSGERLMFGQLIVNKCPNFIRQNAVRQARHTHSGVEPTK
jgi:hypothetical protein